MRRIVHISDLHFGRHDPPVERALCESIMADAPSLIVVSGDLTQRARADQFAAARAFFAKLPFPKLIVPGNHDMPFYNVIARFAAPLARYRRFIHTELCPMWKDDELAVLGLNTARSLAFRNGRISWAQMGFAQARFARVRAELFRVLVTHHPFVTDTGSNSALVGRGASALEVLADSGVHLLLTGHLHRGFVHEVTAHYPALKRSMLVVQAGTAMSTRLRGEANSYNLVTIDLPRLTSTARSFDGTRFVDYESSSFQLVASRWRPMQGATLGVVD